MLPFFRAGRRGFTHPGRKLWKTRRGFPAGEAAGTNAAAERVQIPHGPPESGKASPRGEADAVRRLMRWNLPTTKNRPRRFPSGTPGAVLRFKEVPPRSSATNQNLPEWQVGALPSGSRSLLPPRREVCDPPLNTSSLNLISRIISSRNKSCRAGVTPLNFLLTECRTGR